MPPKKKSRGKNGSVVDLSSSDEDILSDAPRTRRKGSRAASAARESPAAPHLTLTIWTKTGRKGKFTGAIRQKIEYKLAWAAVKPMVITEAEKMLDGLWSLDGCKFYWLGRDKAGSAKAHELHFLNTEEDYREMIADATTGKGGKRRRSDSADKGVLHIAIQLSPEACAPISTASRRTDPMPTSASRASSHDQGSLGDDSLDSNVNESVAADMETDANELCAIHVHQLKLRQPVVQHGAALCTVNWKGEGQTAVVNSMTLKPPLILTGDSGELAELTKHVDTMICKLGESSDTKTSHYAQQCDETDESTAVFWLTKNQKSNEGIIELASSETLGNLVPENKRKKGLGSRRKEHVDMMQLYVSKPSTLKHPYVKTATEQGTWDSAEASSSQGSQAREPSNRPPILLGKEKRTELRDKRVADSAVRGQVMAALKGMCERGKTSGALMLLPSHRSAICDLIEQKMLDEVTVGEGWNESYIKDLPWSPDAVDETKTCATQAVHLALIAALCKRSDTMRDKPEERIPKPYPKDPLKKRSALDRIADNGLTINQMGRSAGADQQQISQNEPQCQATTTAAASATATNDHIEALQKRQNILETQVRKLKAKKDIAITDDDLDKLKAKIDKLQAKIDAIDDEICDLV